MITDSPEQPPESESEEDQPDSEGEEETPQNGPVVPPAPASEVPGYARSERQAEEITEVASEELAPLASQLQVNAEAEGEDDAVTDENRRFEDAEEDDTSSGDSPYSEPVDPILTIPIREYVVLLESSEHDQPAGALNLRVHRRFPPLRPRDPLPREASELPVGARFTLDIDNDLQPYIFLDPEGQKQWLSRPGPSDEPSDSHDQDRPPEENEELPELVMDDSDDANPTVPIVAPADDNQR
ncbi:Haze protective factor 1 [Gracilaria domingensis]|nr:Haze protective factor 1 [Gracilaria domingensis]